MNDENLRIDITPLDENIEKLDENIREMETILKDTLQGYETLDENTWIGPEKKKLDDQFLPYLKKISIKYPELLNASSTFLKKSSITYQNLDKKLKEEIDEDLIV